MRTRKIEIKISLRLAVDVPTPKEFIMEVTLYDDWIDNPKSELELILEQFPFKEGSPQPKLEDLPQYKHLAKFSIEEAASEVLGLVIKRYMLLRRTLSDEHKLRLDKILANQCSQPSSKPELNKNLQPFLSKEKIAAFHHINDAYSSIPLALASATGVKILLAGLYALYSGEHRYFKNKTKSRSEIAAEGGIARTRQYLATKQKACDLLNALTPQEGWNQELDAFKAIIEQVEKYLIDNKIKYPALSNIQRTLRTWIKDDPLVSACVMVRNQPPTDKETK